MSTALSIDNLVLQKEKTYFNILAFFACLVWLAVLISVIGIFAGLVVGFAYWMIHGRFVAHFKSEALLVNSGQLPELHQSLVEVCQKLNFSPIPEIYVANGNGVVNAFSTPPSSNDSLGTSETPASPDAVSPGEKKEETPEIPKTDQ